MAARGPKMADGVWKGVYPEVFERSHHLSLSFWAEHSFYEKSKLRKEEKQAGAELGQAQLKLELELYQ